jgi:xanthine/uracil permease
MSEIVAGGMILFSFGLIYNQAIGSLDRRGYLEGFTWLAVVLGVGTTLAVVVGMAWRREYQGWQWGLLMLGGFAASGLPMAMGAIWRYVSARRADQSDLRRIQ